MENNQNSKTTNTKEKVYNLKNDIIFKAFFSRKGNEEFLIDFLNAILKINIEKIDIKNEVSLEQLDPNEKGGRLDLQATLNDGIIVNIELQIEDKHNIEGRTTFYSAKVISMETERGTEYKDINQVVMINILDYEMFDFEEYISETAIVLDKHREYEVLKGIKWYFIELPKFRRMHPDMNDKINQWLAFIDDYDKGMVKMAEDKNPTLKKAREEMTYLTGDEAVKRLAFLREKWEMDRISDINYAKREGEKLGLEKGEKLGLEKGEKLGLEKGRTVGELQKAKEIAKEMLKENMDIELIAKITKLPKEEIEKLK